MKASLQNMKLLLVMVVGSVGSISSESGEVCSKESCDDLDNIDWEDENFSAQFRKEILAGFDFHFCHFKLCKKVEFQLQNKYPSYNNSF